MSLFDEDEWSRWTRQAQQTLKASMDDHKAGNFNWACFKTQQAAEYAVKGILRGLGDPAAGHSVLKLLEKLSEKGIEILPSLSNHARTLDIHYIPTRYPNAYPEGSPFEFYEASHSNSALHAAGKILQFIQEEKDKIDQSP